MGGLCRVGDSSFTSLTVGVTGEANLAPLAHRSACLDLKATPVLTDCFTFERGLLQDLHGVEVVVIGGSHLSHQEHLRQVNIKGGGRVYGRVRQFQYLRHRVDFFKRHANTVIACVLPVSDLHYANIN